MKTKITIAVALVTLLSLTYGCASTHPGQMGVKVKGSDNDSIKVSAQKQSDYSDDHYTFVTFTVENQSELVLRIKSAEISFKEPLSSTANVLVGDDLVAWATAEQEELDQSKQNKKIGKLALMLGGAILGGIGHSSHSDLIAGIGSGAFIGGAAWTVSDAIHAGTLKGETPERVPSEHIYAPFSVPIGKYLRKWAVIQHPKDVSIYTAFLKLVSIEGTETTYEINFKL